MDSVHEMLGHPHTLIGLSDGGAHVGIICDATDMAHTHWTLDRSRGPRHGIEDMVHRLTSANARAMGLHDRGLIVPGLRTDINVVDYDNLRLAGRRCTTTCRRAASGSCSNPTVSTQPSCPACRFGGRARPPAQFRAGCCAAGELEWLV